MIQGLSKNKSHKLTKRKQQLKLVNRIKKYKEVVVNMIIPIDEHKNQIEMIKHEKNKQIKMKLIGVLILDLGNRSINAVAKACNCCWRFAKKSYNLVLNITETNNNPETRGRKKLTDKYPELENDIKAIIENSLLIDPRFKSEKQYVKMSIQEIKKRLIKTGKYSNKSFSNSSLNNIVNQMGYKLKKVQKIKPLKKIEETDAIFENVQKKKQEAMEDKYTALISLDTKDKVLLGPFSRGGKNRVQIEAVDHELTNNCLIPFGILDIKNNTPYFFNYTSKPTSLDLVDCIEEFYVEQYYNTDVNKLSILLDNGPDNSGIRTIFLKGLIEVSKKYNIKIELIYYPPYHSKYNPVERLWARLENVWNGYLLETKEICLAFMKNLTWKNSHSVTKLKEVKYEKGLTVEKVEMKALENRYITRTQSIKKWSVLIIP